MPLQSLLSRGRWSGVVLAPLAIAACSNRASGVGGSGSSAGASGVASLAMVSGTSTGATSGADAGVATGTLKSSGSSGSSGTGSSGSSGMSGTTIPGPATFMNYELTGMWPALVAGTAANPIKQTRGALTYKMVQVQDQFLAESCSIADYNDDGIPDISSGHRWYEGPDFKKAHIYRSGHEAQPRDGMSATVGFQQLVSYEFDGVSDDWADYPFDMDGDGWPDIINIASPSGVPPPVSDPAGPPLQFQQNSTGYWYKNPGYPANTTDSYWAAYLLSQDVQMEQRALADVDGDGKPEILAACKTCGRTKGYYQGDWANPTAAWTFRAVTRVYEFPFEGTGIMNGIGMGDIDGDGKPDFFERSGAWLQPPASAITAPRAAETCTGYSCTPWQWVAQALSGGEGQPLDLSNEDDTGGSHMFAYDVDGDGDMDIVSADSAFGWGLSWYEQTTPITSCIGHPSSLTFTGLEGDAGTVANCFVKHPIVATNSAADLAVYGVAFSEPASLQLVDMDGDGLSDIITGKMFLAKAYSQGDPDNRGTPVLYVFKLVRDANPPKSGKAHFEPHLVNAAVNTADAGALPNWVGGSGVGRQIAIGQINPQTDGIMVICIASKLGLFVYFGQ
jgi:hypothetical protein